jgi:hypothetical protein
MVGWADAPGPHPHMTGRGVDFPHRIAPLRVLVHTNFGPYPNLVTTMSVFFLF